MTPQGLTTLAASSRGSHLDPSIDIRQLTNTHASSSMVSEALFWPLWDPHICVHIVTHNSLKITNKKINLWLGGGSFGKVLVMYTRTPRTLAGSPEPTVENWVQRCTAVHPTVGEVRLSSSFTS